MPFCVIDGDYTCWLCGGMRGRTAVMFDVRSWVEKRKHLFLLLCPSLPSPGAHPLLAIGKMASQETRLKNEEDVCILKITMC